MDTDCDTDERHSILSLTRLIYSFCGSIILYLLLAYSARFLFARMRGVQGGLYRSWYDVTNLCFVAAMLLIPVTYRFKSEVLCWERESTTGTTSWIKSISLGVLGGVAALLIASPIVWFGWDNERLHSIEWLVADALSFVPVLKLLLVILSLAFSAEVVFRGIVFRTLARYTTIPAAALASCLLFAYIVPVLGVTEATILGVTSSILYYKTKNLIAPILANALVTVGCSGIALYHRLM